MFKNLYNSLEREYNNAMDDLTIYTWSRNWAMDVFIWGRAWNQELTKWIPAQVRYLDSGSTWIQLDELRCQDDDFFELSDFRAAQKSVNLADPKTFYKMSICILLKKPFELKT